MSLRRPVGDDRYVQLSAGRNQEKSKHEEAFPIDPLLPDIIESLKINTLVLIQASPGAGKTTRVPRSLVDAGFGSIYILEPRRLAARMAARRVAEEFHQAPGQTVGYQVRFEEVGNRDTKIWYLTEGVLTRKLLSGSHLPGVQVVILDEFHERHLETDLALSLLLHLQANHRPDLKLIIMSATLASANLAAALGNPPLIQSAARSFPISISYTPYSAAPLEEQVAAAVATALNRTQGDILVFLPGAAEIRKALQACLPLARSADATLHALHGDLPPDEQDRAVRRAPNRKIICSTNVAESSITIEGVDAVVDSGLARVLTYSAWSGLARLSVEKISRSSLIQRSGRAGRTGPGIAIRLFPETDFVRRPESAIPEVIRADFAPTLLQLAASNIPFASLQWLNPPAAENVEQAGQLLTQLAAFNAAGAITSTGREMARLPLHPRLARFLVAAAEAGVALEAADLAARLSESRFRFDERTQAACASDIDGILAAEPSYATRQLRQQLNRLLRNNRFAPSDPHALEKSLMLAFPDRIARRRGETLLLADGVTARLDRQSLAAGDFLLALEVDERSDQAFALVRIASHIEPDWLLDAFPDQIETTEELIWNRDSERVEQRSLLRYRRLTLDESSTNPRQNPAATELLVSKAVEAGIERFCDAEALAKFMLRLRFAAGHMSGLTLPADALTPALRELASGLVSFAELRTAARDNALLTILESHLPMHLVEQVAPTHITLPSGRRARIEYHDGRPPSVASRLQDFFGMKSTPTVARGAVPLVVQLLAPNHRPVQVTTDLVSFWKNLYPQLRRELSRRYPRHAWPESPD